MNRAKFLLLCLVIMPLCADAAPKIYHKGWIDFNKNGKMDVYENPKADLDARIEDLLSQMTVEEKTCQMATLYGYRRKQILNTSIDIGLRILVDIHLTVFIKIDPSLVIDFWCGIRTKRHNHQA